MIPLCIPNMSGKEQDYAAEAISSGWVNEGPFIERFERMVAKETNRKWCIATITGTAALDLALYTHPDPFIPMPSYTFIAAANVIRARGSKLMFRDIDSDWSPDYSYIGNVRDAAPAITLLKNLKDKLSVLSFNANKIITTGQGGAIVGNDPDLEMELRHLATTAKVGPYIHDRIGFNYRMSNINAAVGVAQMERLEEFQARKYEIFSKYRDAGLDILDSCWMALWKTNNRNDKILALLDKGIGARQWWTPIHLQEPYKNMCHWPLPKTEELWQKIISLPCSTGMTNEEVDQVIEGCLSL